MHSPNSVTILYGSETGNAQDYAHYLARKLRYISLLPSVAALNDYPPEKLITDTRFLIVVCSTTGQGEIPRNGKKFLRFLLRKKLPGDLLSHVRLTSFGLGDTSYVKFNYAIKKLHTRLMQLGCLELSPRCESDEMAPEGVDGFFSEWVDSLVDSLRSHFPGLPTLDDHLLLPPEYTLSLKEDADALEEPLANGLSRVHLADLSLTRRAEGLRTASVVANSRLTPEDHFQDVRHLIFRVPVNSAALHYSPGDSVALYPPNDPSDVDLLFKSQPHWLPIADLPLQITSPLPVEGGLIDPHSLTLRNLFTYHLDILSVPRRSFFSLLFHFVDASTEDGKREKEKLYEFTKLDESEALYDYANRPRRSILETIMEFENNLEIPVDYVLDLFPLIKVRLFLIASRPSTHSVELLIGIVEYRTILRRIRRGLCTKWVKTLKPGDKLVFSVHPSKLNFNPLHPKPPILMIAPGTGIAPMKSLIDEVAGHQDLYLFPGFRDSAKDFFFEDVWKKYEDMGQLKVFPAISRQEGFKHKYVQDRLFEEKALVSRLLLHEKAVVFLCGASGKMPIQVRLTLAEILREEVEEPEAFLLQLENEGRFIQETW